MIWGSRHLLVPSLSETSNLIDPFRMTSLMARRTGTLYLRPPYLTQNLVPPVGSMIHLKSPVDPHVGRTSSLIPLGTLRYVTTRRHSYLGRGNICVFNDKGRDDTPRRRRVRVELDGSPPIQSLKPKVRVPSPPVYSYPVPRREGSRGPRGSFGDLDLGRINVGDLGVVKQVSTVTTLMRDLGLS